jgi:hypothetical protein
MKKISLVILLLSIFSLSCEDKDFFNFNTFEGYTSRDFEGFLVGTADSDDWNFNDDWKRAERKLFADFDDYNYDCEIDTTIEIIALPNPTTENIFISMIKDSTIKFDYRLVNEKMDILISQNDITDNQFFFNVVDSLTDETIVRLYYRLKKDDKCAFIGHGDIKIN